MKIINILCHVHPKLKFTYKTANEYLTRFPESKVLEVDEYPFLIAFPKLDWHHRWGKYIKYLEPQAEIECWRVYDGIRKVYQTDVDGIHHKVFPVFDVGIKKFGHIKQSRLLLRDLRQEIKQRDDLIIHFYDSHDPLMFWLVNKIKHSNASIILQNLGGWLSWFDWKMRNNPLKLIRYVKERRVLNYVSLYLQSSKTEEQFLRERVPKLKQQFFLNGIDFDEFPVYDKPSARRIIGVEIDAKVMLYVGRLNNAKGVQKIIEAFNKAKTQIEKLELFLVGGYEEDEYYQLAISSGAKVIIRTDKPINLFYAASDLYVLVPENKFIVEFGGFGIAPIEALANNTRVVSPNIKHYEPEEDIEKLGVLLKKDDNLEEVIKKYFSSESLQTDVRALIKKSFDIRVNSEKLYHYYKELLPNSISPKP